MPNPAIWMGAGANAATRMLALAPSHQFRADTVTLSGGNVATIPNRRGSDALVLSAGTLAAPAPDALFGGAPSLVFTGTQWLDSNLAASAWKFLHNGTGAEVVHVFAPTSLASRIVVHSTLAVTTGAAFIMEAGGALRLYIADASGGIVLIDSTTLLAAVQATYGSVAFSVTDPLVAQVRTTSSTPTSATNSRTPANTDAGPLRLGAHITGNANPASMRWCETLVFPRVLHEYERQIVREYIAARYGIAAPSLTGADREIMSLLPFAWLDAGTANINAGKVVSFIDRARPGHLFLQGNTTLQVATPAAASDFNNASVATFVAASSTRYSSTLAASAWRFLHSGASCELFIPFAATADTQHVMLSSRATGTGYSSVRELGGAVTHRVRNGATPVVEQSGGNAVVGAPAGLNASYSSSASPNAVLRLNGAQLAAGAQSSAPAAGDSDATLCIGARTDGVLPASMRLASVLLFNRVLSAADRARAQAAVLTKYGVAI